LGNFQPALTLASLKLAEFGFERIKERLSKKQKDQFARQAQHLVQAASMEDIRKYDTSERRRISGLTVPAGKRKARPKVGAAKKVARKRR
jgi:hypothetical protein